MRCSVVVEAIAEFGKDCKQNHSVFEEAEDMLILCKLAFSKMVDVAGIEGCVRRIRRWLEKNVVVQWCSDKVVAEPMVVVTELQTEKMKHHVCGYKLQYRGWDEGGGHLSKFHKLIPPPPPTPPLTTLLTKNGYLRRSPAHNTFILYSSFP
ncbi:hypothetical protein TSUD_327000 [Trifolium subterraneum]|uniref:Uncharacterized protein n=1 Tax=Trifolium subterraneum TaxID=3900 RepID=A0A2Z6LXA3_TRISU|nr:hypothetical protein TSUD_327000 [Trifolium subterraneum]